MTNFGKRRRRLLSCGLWALQAGPTLAWNIGTEVQQVLRPDVQPADSTEPPTSSWSSPVKLHGRFIHLTDMHPDPYYKHNASEAGACHSPHSADKGDRAGYWGQPVSDCDAPLTLVNATFDWLEQHWKGKVDFVVWTGDNARHDIDSRYPRSLPEIFDLNRYIAQRIRKTFGHVPVVASIGNNDIFPHNIMFGGPSKITNEFLSIWKHFIPEVHLHSFAAGGYYSVEAIPGQLLLISLNTIYFYENNKAVDGCPSFSANAADLGSFKKDDDPGTTELLWLEQQLLLARARGMQVWLTGHVPATKTNWYEGCYRRYAQLTMAYHDTIVGHLFGHLNVDHFNLIREKDVRDHNKKKRKGKKGKKPAWLNLLPSSDGEATASMTETVSSESGRVGSLGSVSALLNDLLDQYRGLPKMEQARMQDYSVLHVNPSVIPTYLPAFRLWEYNTTAEARWRQPPDWDNDLDEQESDSAWPRALEALRSTWFEIRHRLLGEGRDSDDHNAELEAFGRDPSSAIDGLLTRKKRKHKHRRKKKKYPSYPKLPRHFNASSPSQTNTYLSPLGYTQYMLDLEEANRWNGFGSEQAERRGGSRSVPQWRVEYTTLEADIVATRLVDGARVVETELLRNTSRSVWPPKVRDLVERGAGADEVAEALRSENLAPYELADGTIASWLRLAKRLGTEEKAWKGYRKRMFVSSGADE